MIKLRPGFPKVHKDHVSGKVPPRRPIISGSGSITEDISHYVQHQIKDFSKRHASYPKDTQDLLRFLKDIGPLTEAAILATIDISNIQREDGVEAMRKALETREDKYVPVYCILELLDLVLKYNIFEFEGELYPLLVATAMGSLDIFMGLIDEEIIS